MNNNEETEIRSISGKILAFGVCALIVTLIVACLTMGILLYFTSQRLLDEKSIVLDTREEVYDLRRENDRLSGRLSVYDDFLIGTQISALKQMVTRYLRHRHVKSDTVSLSEFEEWVYTGSFHSVKLGGIDRGTLP